MAASIKEIARLAGVSTATVSRVFSGRGYVSGETRSRVEELAARHGYKPKPYSRQAAPAYAANVGVVIPDIRNNYYMEVIQGIEGVLNPAGCEVLICNTDEDPRKEIRSLASLQRLGVKGLIAVPVSEAEQYNADFLGEINRSIPVVLLDRDISGGGIDGVFMDNFNSAYQSVQAFAANGHTHIAIISGPTTSTSGVARLNGYLAGLQACGLPVREEYILYGDFKFDLAARLTKKLVQRHKGVTAIFAANSRMSMGCLFALAELGMAVPQDMAFISCGRLEPGTGAISAVEYPTAAIGEECARMLLEKMRAGRRPPARAAKRTTFSMQLVLKGSEQWPQNRTKPEKREEKS